MPVRRHIFRRFRRNEADGSSRSPQDAMLQALLPCSLSHWIVMASVFSSKLTIEFSDHEAFNLRSGLPSQRRLHGWR